MLAGLKSSATPQPPMHSTTTETSGSCSMTEKSWITRWAYGLSGNSRVSRMYLTATGSSVRRRISAWFMSSTSATPEPTVPKPRIAMFAMVNLLCRVDGYRPLAAAKMARMSASSSTRKVPMVRVPP